MIRKQSPKRLSDIASGKVRLGHNSTIAVKKAGPKERMTIDELKASGLLTKASKVGKSDRAKWKAKADKYFSEFIRLRDSDEHGRVKCITCSHTEHWRQLQCGHYVTRGHEATRFDELNCNTQCRGCNYNGGQHLKHKDAIDRKHGMMTAETLEDKARVPCRRTAGDYRFLAETYKARVDRIKETEPGRYFGRGA